MILLTMAFSCFLLCFDYPPDPSHFFFEAGVTVDEIEEVLSSVAKDAAPNLALKALIISFFKAHGQHNCGLITSQS